MTNGIRVGFDARWYNDSGVGTYVAGLLTALCRPELGVDLIVYEDPKNPVPGLDVTQCERVAVRSGTYSLRGQIELSRRTKRDGLDVFHSPFYGVPLTLDCPVVVTIHDLIPFLFSIYPRPKQFLIKMGYRLALSRAEQIIAVSGNTASDLTRLLGVPARRISTIHNAVLEEAFHPRQKRGELDLLETKSGVRAPYVVVSSARNWRTKNLSVALQALALAREKAHTAFQTVVYGSEEGLTAALRHNSWPDLHLRTTGHLVAAELGMLFRHARAFVMPSLYEGFGLPVLEAMACGCAVLTSNAGSLAEVAGEGAQIFGATDVEGLAQALATLLRDPQELTRWQERALVRAADFSWCKAARETVSVYHRAWRHGDAVE
ncbi:MAG TPA: glycosyltransferase family 1 protein [Verrucomicrobiae bacterium]|nr:glycosyltransferase family 1 protein [Verrucomicrobiae bacterium]